MFVCVHGLYKVCMCVYGLYKGLYVCAWVVQSVSVCAWVIQSVCVHGLYRVCVCVCMGCTKCVCAWVIQSVCVCVHGLYKGLLSCVVVQRVALICVWGVEEGSGVQKWVVGCRSG